MLTAFAAEAVFGAPAPKQIIATVAPNAAPCETPRVEASANGLRNTLCITQPTMPSAMPAIKAVTTRGKRIPKTIELVCFVPAPKIVFITSQTEIPEEPAWIANIVMASNTTIKIIITITL